MPDRIHAAGPQLRPAKVRLDDTAAPDDLLRATQVCGHPVPGRRVVVRAVDAHQVHPGPQQVLDQARVVGRGTGHRHHDADLAVTRRGTEQPARVLPQQQASGAEIDRWMRRLVGRNPGQRLETGNHRVQPRDCVGLEHAERRQSEGMQVVLQAADVGLADAEVVQQVAGAVAVMRLDRLDVGCVRRFECERAVAQVAQLGKRALDETVGGHGCGAGARPSQS